jgi:type II secretory pathway component PulF
MRRVKKSLVMVGAILGVLGLLGGAVAVMIARGLHPGLLLILFVGLFYGWMLFAFLHYRQGRQDEFLHLLTTAVEANVPLAPALWTYLEDRPHGVQREAWVALLLFFVFPGYYWIWHRRHNFDYKVARVARLIEVGVSLPEALRSTPGVASRDTLLAAAIGESTGKLAYCLRNSAMWRPATLWLQITARLLYPLILLFVLFGIMSFWMTYILPKMQRIFYDFHQPFPETTERLIQGWYLIEEYEWVISLAFFGLVGLVLLLTFSSTLRWYLPGISRLYRMHVQGRVLKMLGVLLEAGKPVPEALGLLANSGYFAGMPRRRLQATRRLVVQGEALPTSLRRRRLLPRAMVPLLQAAQRMQNLPWALAELGENRINRVHRLLRNLSLATTPLLVLAVGLVVGFIVFSMFSPLVQLIMSVGE